MHSKASNKHLMAFLTSNIIFIGQLEKGIGRQLEKDIGRLKIAALCLRSVWVKILLAEQLGLFLLFSLREKHYLPPDPRLLC